MTGDKNQDPLANDVRDGPLPTGSAGEADDDQKSPSLDGHSEENDRASPDEPFDPFRYQLRTIPPELRAQLLHVELPLLRPDEIAEPAPFGQRIWGVIRGFLRALHDFLWRRVSVASVLVWLLLVFLSILVALGLSRAPHPAARGRPADRPPSSGSPSAARGRASGPGAATAEPSADLGSLAPGSSLPSSSSPPSDGISESTPVMGQTPIIGKQGPAPGAGGAAGRRPKLWLPD